MAFQPKNLILWNVPPSPGIYGLPQWWGYFTTDAIAAVSASGYFNLGYNLTIPLGANSTWFVGDLLYCVCSDGVVELQIATVGSTVTTTASSSLIPANSITTAMLQAGAVTLAKLATGIAPSHIIKYAAKYTTVGGAAAEAITIAGVLVSDLGFVQLVNQGPNTVTVKIAVISANTLTVTFSADPGAGAIIDYQILRAAS